MNRRALFTGGGIGALAFTLGLGWWRVDGPGAPVGAAQASTDPLLPLPLTEMGWTLTEHQGGTGGDAPRA